MEVTSNVLTFASGKGGVGKSVVTTNLAETLAREGHRVALLDADLGQSDAAVLLNEAPATTVWGAVQEDAALRAVPHETEGGVTLVQAANRPPPEAPDARDALYAALDTLLGRLRETHDYVLVDASAGTDGPVQWALDRADLGVLVVVGEPTAVADAYRLAKQLWSADPDYPLGLVVNFAEDEDDARSIGERFKAVTTRFLGQAPKTLGWIPFSHAVRRSVPGAVRPLARPLMNCALHVSLRLPIAPCTMPSSDTASVSLSYHTIIADVSVLFGTGIFLAQMWGGAPLEHTVVAAAGGGVATYLILAVGYAAARSIVQHGMPFETTAEEDASDEGASAESEPEPSENVPEAQAA